VAWHDRAFDELSIHELYAITVLRERVFVVEQSCVYLDADGIDPQCRHIWADGYRAYLRVVPPGVRYAHRSIGRVIVAPEARGTGLGKELMRFALDRYGDVPIEIGAQAYLQRFYEELGFRRIGDVYDEDGIPHIHMLR
jgi:ElaA protein